VDVGPLHPEPVSQLGPLECLLDQATVLQSQTSDSVTYLALAVQVTCNIAVSLASYFEGERGQAMEEKDLLVSVVEDQSLKWAGMTVADD